MSLWAVRDRWPSAHSVFSGLLWGSCHLRPNIGDTDAQQQNRFRGGTEASHSARPTEGYRRLVDSTDRPRVWVGHIIVSADNVAESTAF